MSTTVCPACSHAFDPATTGGAGVPELSVVRWFAAEESGLGDISTAEAYARYLRSTDEVPASRARFVADLAHLGVEEVLDDDTHMLIRD